MSRKAIILVALAFLALGIGLVGVGFIGEHRRDADAAERGVPAASEDRDSSIPIGAFVAIGAALIAATQAKRRKNDKHDG